MARQALLDAAREELLSERKANEDTLRQRNAAIEVTVSWHRRSRRRQLPVSLQKSGWKMLQQLRVLRL